MVDTPRTGQALPRLVTEPSKTLPLADLQVIINCGSTSDAEGTEGLSWATARMLRMGTKSLSQMDVPTRQSYTMAVVEPDERSAAAGVTGIARTVGAALAPLAAGPLYASAALASVPFLAAAGLKIVYDLVLWRSFRALRPPEERR